MHRCHEGLKAAQRYGVGGKKTQRGETSSLCIDTLLSIA